MDHGVDAQHHVELELKQDQDLALLAHVVVAAWDLPLKQDLAEPYLVRSLKFLSNDT